MRGSGKVSGRAESEMSLISVHMEKLNLAMILLARLHSGRQIPCGVHQSSINEDMDMILVTGLELAMACHYLPSRCSTGADP